MNDMTAPKNPNHASSMLVDRSHMKSHLSFQVVLITLMNVQMLIFQLFVFRDWWNGCIDGTLLAAFVLMFCSWPHFWILRRNASFIYAFIFVLQVLKIHTQKKKIKSERRGICAPILQKLNRQKAESKS